MLGMQKYNNCKQHHRGPRSCFLTHIKESPNTGAFTVPTARDLFPFVIPEHQHNTLTTFLISLMVWSDFMFSVRFRRRLCRCRNNFCCSCQNLLNLTLYFRDKESTYLQKCTGWKGHGCGDDWYKNACLLDKFRTNYRIALKRGSNTPLSCLPH